MDIHIHGKPAVNSPAPELTARVRLGVGLRLGIELGLSLGLGLGSG